MSGGRPPNIVIVLCDQMRAFEAGCYGHPVCRTPNLDRLAAAGALFEVACSNAPLCVPARNCLLTGQHARTCTGTTTNFCGFPPSRQRLVCRDPALPELLRDAGYATGVVGKWHLHPAPDVLGFREGTIVHSHHQHYHQSFHDLRGENPRVVRGLSLDHEIAQVEAFVRGHREEPFFLLYSLSPPHSPLDDAPQRYLSAYSREQAVIRDNAWLDGELAADRQWFWRYLYDYLALMMLTAEQDDWTMDDDQSVRETQALPHGVLRVFGDLANLMRSAPYGGELRRALRYADDRRLDGFDLRDLTALYYANITMVDDYLGRLMALLHREGLEEDTIVVFTSDHGDNLGSHGLWNKGHIFDESICIPLVVRWPGHVAEQRISRQVGSLIDLMPTLLSLAGVEVPATVQGLDLAAVLTGRQAATEHPHAFIEGLFPQIAVRTPTHTYGMEMEGEPEAERRPAATVDRHYLFDNGADPFQLDNLAPAGGGGPPAGELRRLLADWHRDTPRWDLQMQTHRRSA